MKIEIVQIYIEVGVRFDLSAEFQGFTAAELSRLVDISPEFASRFGEDWSIVLNLSAKKAIPDVAIMRPIRLRKDKVVEITIFLPFDKITQSGNVRASAVRSFLEAVQTALAKLGLDVARLTAATPEIVKRVADDP